VSSFHPKPKPNTMTRWSGTGAAANRLQLDFEAEIGRVLDVITANPTSIRCTMMNTDSQLCGAPVQHRVPDNSRATHMLSPSPIRAGSQDFGQADANARATREYCSDGFSH